MLSISLLLLLSWTISPLLAVGNLSCYVCAGYDCLAQPQFIQQCVSPSTSDCFYVTANNTELYRGCYEDQNPHKWLCQEHILNKCTTCNTSLCNDQPAYRPETLSCYKCSPPSAQCRDPVHMAHHFQPCRPFLFTDLPACYSLYDHRTFEYEFGCLSEASLAVRATCDQDWFRLTCHVCHWSRCNVHLFYKETEGDLQCFGQNNRPLTCPYHETNRPYYACYIESKVEIQDKGCTSERFAHDGIADWMNLMRIGVPNDNIHICMSPCCNSVLYESE